MSFKRIRFIFWSFCLLVATGCGYHLAGSGSLPSGITTVAIPVLKNQTAETGFESVLTNALIYEFTRRRVTVTSKADAQALLIGAITASDTETISHKDEYVSRERRVRVQVALNLVKKEGGQVLWAVTALEELEDYLVEDDELSTQRNKKAALKRLSENLAETVYGRITADF